VSANQASLRMIAHDDREQPAEIPRSTTQLSRLWDSSNFWTYDDPVSRTFKMEYVQEHHLAGIMIWEISDDEPDARSSKPW